MQAIPPPPPDVPTDPPASVVPEPAVEYSTDMPPVTGIPGTALVAYRNAERILSETNPLCGLHWSLLAGIGRIESNHVFGGRVNDDGNPWTPVFGPLLDGSLAGNVVVYDSDGGAMDWNAEFDRAIGPMQFLPQTWSGYAVDGNGDGIADPQNIFDAALAAGEYLCDSGTNLADTAQRVRAILRYNASMAYVRDVMAAADEYRQESTPEDGEVPPD